MRASDYCSICHSMVALSDPEAKPDPRNAAQRVHGHCLKRLTSREADGFACWCCAYTVEADEQPETIVGAGKG